MVDNLQESLEQRATEDLEEPFQNSIPSGGDIKCPKCGSEKIVAQNIRDAAFSIHYIDDIADFSCYNCKNKWQGQYGYRGLA